MSTAELGESLPEGVFHLLTADDDVTSTYQGYVAVCGEVLVASDLPASCYSFPGIAWSACASRSAGALRCGFPVSELAMIPARLRGLARSPTPQERLR